MVTDLTATRTRRAFITTTVGAAAAVAAAQVVRPAAVEATDGNSIVIGAYQESTTQTQLVKTNNGAMTFRAAHEGSGAGLVGVANHAFGTGVLAGSEDGTALGVLGRTRFADNSGVARIKTGRTKVVVSRGVDVKDGDFVPLTPRSKLSGRDLWFSIQPAKNTFTIHMSAKRSKKTFVSWLLLS